MKEYELIIETHQPSCGGKPPVLHDFKEIETEEPSAYVKSHTKNAELTIDTAADGSIVITADESGRISKYIFTEI
jgi:hypothetical protein